MRHDQKRHEQLTRLAANAFATHQITHETEDVIRIMKPHPDGRPSSEYAVQLTRDPFGLLIVSGDIGPVVFGHGPPTLHGLIGWIGQEPELGGYIREKASIGTRHMTWWQFPSEREIVHEHVADLRETFLSEADVQELDLWRTIREEWLADDASLEGDPEQLADIAADIAEHIADDLRWRTQSRPHAPSPDVTKANDLIAMLRERTWSAAELRAKLTEFTDSLLEGVPLLDMLNQLKSSLSADEWVDTVCASGLSDPLEVFPPPQVMSPTLYYAHAAVHRANQLINPKPQAETK